METSVRSQGRFENGARLHIEPREPARRDRPALDRIGTRASIVPEPRHSQPVAPIPEIVVQEIQPVEPRYVQPAEPSRPMVRKQFAPKKSKKLRYVVAAAFALLFVVGGLTRLMLRTTTTNTSQVLAAHTSTVQPETVETAPPQTTDDTPPANYLTTSTTSGTLAKIVTLDSLDIKAPVVTVGADGRNHPQQPMHTYQVGWYNVSVHPGEAGAVVLSGACHGTYGVFRTASMLKPEDQITLQRGDGVVLHYQVVRTEKVSTDKLDLTKLLRPVDTETKGLNMVTCGGWYDASTNDYSERLIVYTKQI